MGQWEFLAHVMDQKLLKIHSPMNCKKSDSKRLSIFLEIMPTFIHTCRAHVMQACKQWIGSVDCEQVVCTHVKQMTTILVEYFCHQLQHWIFLNPCLFWCDTLHFCGRKSQFAF